MKKIIFILLIFALGIVKVNYAETTQNTIPPITDTSLKMSLVMCSGIMEFYLQGYDDSVKGRQKGQNFDKKVVEFREITKIEITPQIRNLFLGYYNDSFEKVKNGTFKDKYDFFKSVITVNNQICVPETYMVMNE